MPSGTLQHICDGCGATVAPEHVRQRITRLELATRFRPLHIHTLLLAGAPPPQVSEFFYSPEGKLTGAVWGDVFFRAMMEAAGIELSEGKTAEACLAEFQRHGLYLAYVNECPGDAIEPAGGLASAVARRLRYSYKPKSVLLLDATARALGPALAQEPLPGVRIAAGSGALQPPAQATGDWPRFRDALRMELRAAVG